MSSLLWFFAGLVVGLVADFFLVCIMTRSIKKRIASLEERVPLR